MKLTDFSQLTPTARLVAGTYFGMGAKQTLVFRMVENRPTAQMQAALDELLKAKIIRRKKVNSVGGVEYSARVDCRPLLGWVLENKDKPEFSFPVVEPVAGRAAIQKDGER